MLTHSATKTPYNAHSPLSNSQTLFFTFFPVFIILKQNLLENWCKVEVRKYIQSYQRLLRSSCKPTLLLLKMPSAWLANKKKILHQHHCCCVRQGLTQPRLVRTGLDTWSSYLHPPSAQFTSMSQPAWVLCSFPFWKDLRMSLGRPWAQPFPALASQVSGITSLYQEGFQYTENW